MTKGISLGNHETLQETKDRIKSQKSRLKRILKDNDLKVSPSKFKFHYDKEIGKRYPYFSYVDTPGTEYNWIFIR